MHYIFVHGLGQTPSSWNHVIDCFSTGLQTDCPDIFSFVEGQNATYENMYQGFKEYCNSFDGLLHLCGISLGAVLALNYTIEFPQKIESLTLIAPQYKTPRILLRFQTALFRIMPKSAFRGIGISKRDMILLQKSMLELDFTSTLDRIICPVLIICGQGDKANKKAAKQLVDRLSNAKLTIVKNAGHEVNIDIPEKLAKLIATFNHISFTTHSFE